jgi:Transport protein particle (TRAPP) component
LSRCRHAAKSAWQQAVDEILRAKLRARKRLSSRWPARLGSTMAGPRQPNSDNNNNNNNDNGTSSIHHQHHPNPSSIVIIVMSSNKQSSSISNNNNNTVFAGNALWQKQPKANAELFALTYGAMVGELIRDLEKTDKIQDELDRMGHSMGIRCVEEFLAKAGGDVNSSNNNSFADTADLSK